MCMPPRTPTGQVELKKQFSGLQPHGTLGACAVARSVRPASPVRAIPSRMPSAQQRSEAAVPGASSTARHAPATPDATSMASLAALGCSAWCHRRRPASCCTHDFA